MNVSRSALSLVIHKSGNVSSLDIDELLEHYRSRKGINIDREIYREAVKRASDHYNNHVISLFICTDRPCLKGTFVNPSEKSINALAQELKCPIETTGCHWQCDMAPVVTVKKGTQSRSFLQCSSSEEWQSIRDFLSASREERW